ncbi:ATP-dependent DNA helicase [Nocardioides marmoribigeumensis]|uniref:ATP-dependent DNA helicase DinG n=1 Tax=Nocardioides marmoribigeumensis TaxID=433649 RepID=A0ABU2BPC7_9ACTN|nr:ATP-dependent DNA helicase DinG [Nocardioides marmoribigeumensis]
MPVDPALEPDLAPLPDAPLEDPVADPGTATEAPTVRAVLEAAVAGLGGQERPGQVAMAEAVAAAIRDHTHLLVQAGTGTGKSLGYLVPALLHPERVVVATATLALQHQLVERDLPALADAVAEVLGGRPSFTVLKGRSNYACLHRVREGVPDDQGTLALTLPAGSLGSEVVALREWVEEQASSGGTGDRDHAPRHAERVWRQVSVSARECLGASSCSFGDECFAERARDKAARSRLIVTNHSMLAIDAIDGVPMIPDYSVVVVDEAHELASRVTQASTDELTPTQVERAAKRASRHVEDAAVDQLYEAADALTDALATCRAARLDPVPDDIATALALTRDAAREAVSAFPKESPDSGDAAAAKQARAWCQEVFDAAERMAAGSSRDVLWKTERERQRGGDMLSVAPLDVWGPLRDGLLADNTVVFTSATLKLGGDFDAVASGLGLRADERRPLPPADEAGSGADSDARDGGEDGAEDETEDGRQPWRGLDVGSPFDYPRQGILYVARHLPRPGRDGLGEAQVAEIADLVDAAEGRTLGLFSSRRAAETAAEAIRERLPHLTVLAQGDAQLPDLTAQFVGDPHTCLFGTLGLWQGLDVPGDTCQLVIIDRIPFPRPDDPLMSARQQAADRAGRNGFLSVAATHAALLLAQGSGRLIRTTTDRGVVAVLDPRLQGMGYSGFLRSSLPPMWSTTDKATVLAALRRLSAP